MIHEQLGDLSNMDSWTRKLETPRPLGRVEYRRLCGEVKLIQLDELGKINLHTIVPRTWKAWSR